MQVIQGIENYPSFSKYSVIAVGNFDGVHLGHQKILQLLVNEAKKHDFIPVVVTFFPHPEIVFGQQIKLIQTLEQRLKDIKKYGVKAVLVIDFNKKFANLSSTDFIEKIVVKSLKGKEIIVGKDFRFGKNRQGDISNLYNLASKFNFGAMVIPQVFKDGMAVNSSLIRELIQKGNIEKANALLGKPYSIEGTIVKGKAMGKQIGFPTANLQTRNHLLVSGVYISTVTISKKDFPSVTNAGNCPTFPQKITQVECHILNYQKNLYGKSLRINFLKKIRDEIKFSTPAELSFQIKKDLEMAKNYFSSKPSIASPERQ
ncbi:MAG: bifunctional riboflavin kinase/FAD synthetase [Candidatus Aminicenantes bacterium]|nr:bifunctional riboflavin kinase/FAD synthetase [Candidatus Aminicenantes bacterium]